MVPTIFAYQTTFFLFWWHATNLISFIWFSLVISFLLTANHAKPRYRLFVFVCLMPNICLRDQNLQSYFTYGCTGFGWSATHFDSMQHCMPDALGVVGLMHNLRWGKFFLHRNATTFNKNDSKINLHERCHFDIEINCFRLLCYFINSGRFSWEYHLTKCIQIIGFFGVTKTFFSFKLIK